MQVDLAQYDDVVHGIYDASLRPDRWPGVLADAAALLGASRSVLFTWANSPHEGGFHFAHNVPVDAKGYWEIKRKYGDPFAEALVARGLTGEGVSFIGTDLVPSEVLQATDFYKKLWAPANIAQVCFGHVFDATDTHKLPTVISFYRGMNDPPFMSEHAELLRRLLAHFARAMGVMFHLRDNQWRIAATTSALDFLRSGVLLLDAKRRVMFANNAAHALFRRADTVMLNTVNAVSPPHVQLHHRLARYERGFQQAISAALQPLVRDAQHFSQALLLPGEAGEPRCVVHIAPLADSHGFASGEDTARAILFMYDMQSAAAVQPELLCKLFDMTAAEARAALQLTRSGSIDDMAARLGVSANTFKTQLQAAYLKSGTHRQADLLKLLLSLASR